MMHHYRSPYPNYIHQIFITPSKHLYVLKDGRLRWQDKAMDIALENIEESERVHVVHYIVADHTSAAFYAELHTSKTLVTPKAFLTRAWSAKSDFFFYGIPENLVVPTVILKKYPDVNCFLERLEVGNLAPSSGFSAGVHQVRNWEKDVANAVSSHSYFEKTPCTLSNLVSHISRLLVAANNREINRPGVRMTRKQLWELPIEGKPALRVMT